MVLFLKTKNFLAFLDHRLINCQWHKCVSYEERVNTSYKNHKLLYTHHEEDAEVSQLSEEILNAHRMRVKREIAADVLKELLHVLVHGGQFFILLPGILAEAVRRMESRKKDWYHHHLKHMQKGYYAQLHNDISQICSFMEKNKPLQDAITSEAL